jgi:hypothetical protein
VHRNLSVEDMVGSTVDAVLLDRRKGALHVLGAFREAGPRAARQQVRLRGEESGAA